MVYGMHYGMISEQIQSSKQQVKPSWMSPVGPAVIRPSATVREPVDGRLEVMREWQRVLHGSR
jgi:hypothetical protein